MRANLCCSIGSVLGNVGLKWQQLLLQQLSFHFECVFVDILLQLAQGASMDSSKAARVGALRSRLPFVSQAALGALLQLAKEGELPEVKGDTRKDIRHDRDAYVATSGLYGPLHQNVVIADGVELEVCTCCHACACISFRATAEAAGSGTSPVWAQASCDHIRGRSYNWEPDRPQAGSQNMGLVLEHTRVRPSSSRRRGHMELLLARCMLSLPS